MEYDILITLRAVIWVISFLYLLCNTTNFTKYYLIVLVIKLLISKFHTYYGVCNDITFVFCSEQWGGILGIILFLISVFERREKVFQFFLSYCLNRLIWVFKFGDKSYTTTKANWKVETNGDRPGMSNLKIFYILTWKLQNK